MPLASEASADTQVYSRTFVKLVDGMERCAVKSSPLVRSVIRVPPRYFSESGRRFLYGVGCFDHVIPGQEHYPLKGDCLRSSCLGEVQSHVLLASRHGP